MNIPVEKPAEMSGQPATKADPPAIAPSNDNTSKKFSFLGLAKSFGIGALLVSFSGWLIHHYAAPAASSVWEEMVRPRVDGFIMDAIQRSPRIHEFVVTEINDYLSGKIPSRERPSEIGSKLKTLVDSTDKIETISNSLFGSVDSVYTVATDYALEQIKDSVKNTVAIVPIEPAGPVRLFVYADPSQHCIWTFIQAKGDLQRGIRKERLSFSIKLNNNILRDGDNTPTFAQEIGKFIRKRQGTGGGGKDEEESILLPSLTENVQKIEIVPQFPTFDPIKIVGSPDNVPDKQPVVVSLTGYILITRRWAETKAHDCRRNPVTASSINERR